MAAVKVDLPLVTSVKSGSTSVNRVMWGEKRIWPTFPIVLLRDDVYYSVLGIQNNQYIMEEIQTSNIVTCPQVYCKSCYDTGLLRRNDLQLEMVFCGVNSNGRTFFGNSRNDTRYTARWFNTTGTLYLDYRKSSQNGSSCLRINKSCPSEIFSTTNTTTKYLYRAGFDAENNRNFIYVKTYGNDTWDKFTHNSSNNSSWPENDIPEQANEHLYLGNLNSSDYLRFYYMALYTTSDDLLGFWYFKNDNNTYRLYDEVSQTYLSPRSGYNYESLHSVNSSDTVSVDLNNYSGEPPFIVDGSITDATGSYERLVNTTTGIILKGIKIE